MILDITYSNIRVFRDEVVLSMEATDSLEKFDNLIYANSIGGQATLLNTCVIYGPNASGKTTIISSLHSLRNWWNNIYTNWFNDTISPFRLNDFSDNEPTTLSIRFFTAGVLYRYSVSFINGKCSDERLEYESETGTELLFFRDVTKSLRHRVIYGSSISGDNPPLFEVAADRSLLTVFNSIKIPRIFEAANYLISIEIANGYNHFMLQNIFLEIKPWLAKNNNAKRLVSFINCFDINIKNLKIPQKGDSTYGDIKYVHSIRNKMGEIIKDTDFRSELESLGTMTFTILGAKVLQALDEGRPLFIDELDAVFHTEITRTIIQLFRDPEINRKKAQLIITTHNVKLMDENTLRKDQVWFIQKNEDGNSELFSLAEFEEVDEYSNFSQWYLAKRFGAIPNPNIMKIKCLFNSSDALK